MSGQVDTESSVVSGSRTSVIHWQASVNDKAERPFRPLRHTQLSKDSCHL